MRPPRPADVSERFGSLASLVPYDRHPEPPSEIEKLSEYRAGSVDVGAFFDGRIVIRSRASVFADSAARLRAAPVSSGSSAAVRFVADVDPCEASGSEELPGGVDDVSEVVGVLLNGLFAA